MSQASDVGESPNPQAEPMPPAAASRLASRSAFWPFFWFALAAIRAKYQTLGAPWFERPVETWRQWLNAINACFDWAWQMLVLCHQDILFALVAGFLAQGLLLLTWPSRRLRRVAWGLILFCCTLGVVYSMVSVPIFQFLRSPLTWPLIDLLGGPGETLRLGVQYIYKASGLIVTPVAYLLLVGLCMWLLRPIWLLRAAALLLVLVLLPAAGAFLAERTWHGRHVLEWFSRKPPAAKLLYQIAAGMMLPFVLVVIFAIIRGPRRAIIRSGQVFAALCLVGLPLYAWAVHQVLAPGDWVTKHDNSRIADSPHWALLRSYGKEITGHRSVRVHGEYPEQDLEDFRAIRERPKQGLPTQGLRRGPKNVIFIVMESVSTQFLSLYGSSFDTTPNLVRELAAGNAMVFDNLHVPVANSGNSMYAVNLCGYSALSWREWLWENPRTPGTSVAQALKPHGYRTAFVASMNMDYCNGLPFLRHCGFDAVWHWTDLGVEGGTPWWGVDDGAMMDGILDFIQQDPSKPFFISCWNQQTHHPFDPVDGQEDIDFLKGDTKRWGAMWWDLNKYLNAIHHNDKQLARLFDSLRAMGLADDTLVVIIGDHGEAFGHPHPTYGHSGRIYQEDVKIPCILWNPKLFKDRAPEQRREAKIGRLMDLGPTILDLLDMPSPPRWQGRSLFSPWLPPRAYFYGSRSNYLLGVRDGNWKYMLNVTDDVDELYELDRDPDEQVNVAGKHPEICRRSRQRLAAWLDYQIGLYEQDRRGK